MSAAPQDPLPPSILSQSTPQQTVREAPLEQKAREVSNPQQKQPSFEEKEKVEPPQRKEPSFKEKESDGLPQRREKEELPQQREREEPVPKREWEELPKKKITPPQEVEAPPQKKAEPPQKQQVTPPQKKATPPQQQKATAPRSSTPTTKPAPSQKSKAPRKIASNTKSKDDTKADDQYKYVFEVPHMYDPNKWVGPKPVKRKEDHSDTPKKEEDSSYPEEGREPYPQDTYKGDHEDSKADYVETPKEAQSKGPDMTPFKPFKPFMHRKADHKYDKQEQAYTPKSAPIKGKDDHEEKADEPYTPYIPPMDDQDVPVVGHKPSSHPPKTEDEGYDGKDYAPPAPKTPFVQDEYEYSHQDDKAYVPDVDPKEGKGKHANKKHKPQSFYISPAPEVDEDAGKQDKYDTENKKSKPNTPYVSPIPEEDEHAGKHDEHDKPDKAYTPYIPHIPGDDEHADAHDKHGAHHENKYADKDDDHYKHDSARDVHDELDEHNGPHMGGDLDDEPHPDFDFDVPKNNEYYDEYKYDEPDAPFVPDDENDYVHYKGKPYDPWHKNQKNVIFRGNTNGHFKYDAGSQAPGPVDKPKGITKFSEKQAKRHKTKQAKPHSTTPKQGATIENIATPSAPTSSVPDTSKYRGAAAQMH